MLKREKKLIKSDQKKIYEKVFYGAKIEIFKND